MLFHVTARLLRSDFRLTDQPVGSWLWQRLRDKFPEALSAVLMPYHLHLQAAGTAAASIHQQLRNVVHSLARCRQFNGLKWEPVAPPQPIPDIRYARRQLRYLALNPCRAGLTNDPLYWPWSTHRDVVGATARPWVNAERLAIALELPVRHFAERHHEYVSGDPSASVTSTPFPKPLPASTEPSTSLERIALAAVASNRATAADLCRRTPTRYYFLKLSLRHGWRSAPQLARACDLTPRAVRKAWCRPAPKNLEAGSLCLGDERLTAYLRPSERR